MMIPASQTMMLLPRSSDTIRPRLPALRHAGSFGRCSGSSCVAWLLLAVCILVVSGGTSAMPATAVEGQETTESDLGALLDAGDGAVVTLIAGETRLAVHRAVLAARSQVFAAMFAQDPLEASRSEYIIHDVEGPELRKLVAFMYSGRAYQLPGMTPPLLEAAQKYGVSGLRDAFEQQMANQLTVDNAAAKAVLAVTHNYSSLRQAAVNFIRDHGFQVMATQGWAEAVHSYPGAVAEFTRMLVDPPTETSAPATACSEAILTTHSNNDDGQTSATATLSSAHPHTTTLDDAATSHYRTPATAGSEATPSTRPHSDHGQTPAAVRTPSLCSDTLALDEAVVSRLRNLTGEEKGRRLLQVAKEGAVEEVRALLAVGADVGARDENALTALHWAAQEGHVEVARCLLQAGAEVDARETGWLRTPLHLTAAKGHVAVVRLLLAASANPNARNVNDSTPLHSAAWKGLEEVASALLEAGADSGAMDSGGRTALYIATYYNFQQLIRVLESY